MCTALSWGSGDVYFGRTLDHTCSYGEAVIIFPRNMSLPMRQEQNMTHHHAMIGIGCVKDGFPLYYDAVNEKGLGMAGLNFTQSACYEKTSKKRYAAAQFELLPWVLGQCASVEEAVTLLSETNITDTAFSPELPPAKLHWILADSRETVVLEATADGVHIYQNPAGILTNEPPFPMQMFRLHDFMGLSVHPPENRFSKRLALHASSLGMGAIGLPGDTSSQSRFVRAAFLKENCTHGNSEPETINRFFQLLDSVRVLPGCCITDTGESEYTLYQSCYHNCTCYYTTDQSRQITAVPLHEKDMNGSDLAVLPLQQELQISQQTR